MYAAIDWELVAQRAQASWRREMASRESLRSRGSMTERLVMILKRGGIRMIRSEREKGGEEEEENEPDGCRGCTDPHRIEGVDHVAELVLHLQGPQA